MSWLCRPISWFRASQLPDAAELALMQDVPDAAAAAQCGEQDNLLEQGTISKDTKYMKTSCMCTQR